MFRAARPWSHLLSAIKLIWHGVPRKIAPFLLAYNTVSGSMNTCPLSLAFLFLPIWRALLAFLIDILKRSDHVGLRRPVYLTNNSVTELPLSELLARPGNVKKRTSTCKLNNVHGGKHHRLQRCANRMPGILLHLVQIENTWYRLKPQLDVVSMILAL